SSAMRARKGLKPPGMTSGSGLARSRRNRVVARSIGWVIPYFRWPASPSLHRLAPGGLFGRPGFALAARGLREEDDSPLRLLRRQRPELAVDARLRTGVVEPVVVASLDVHELA